MPSKLDATNSTLCAALQTGITGGEKQISQLILQLLLPSLSLLYQSTG
jgi:hypothetical protein